MGNAIKGYKILNPDWTYEGFKYKVGETYEYEGDIGLRGNGFHFCIEIIDCFKCLRFDSNNKIVEVEAIGLVKTGDNKSVTNKIRIVRELDWLEVLESVNIHKGNTGYGNSGKHNSGNENSGDYNEGSCNTGEGNSGYWNTGYWNSGHGNSGYWNSGDYNSGNHNSGWFNSGWCNSGWWNSGDWNLGHRNNGVFCTEEPKIKIFDVQTDMTLADWRGTEASKILYRNFNQNVWIHSEDMTDKEKEQNPSYKTTGGYLKKLGFKEACNIMWNNLTDREKEVIKNIPNFNEEKFEKITGISIHETK